MRTMEKRGLKMVAPLWDTLLPGHFWAYIAVTVPTSRYFRIPGITSDSRTFFHASDTREQYSANLNSFAVKPT